MLSITHAAIATCAVSLIVGTADPMILLTAAVASQLPDADSTKSYSGMVLYPIAKYLEGKFAHRSITHSFMASGIVCAIASPLAIWFSWQIWLAVSIGYFFGWFSDTFTTSGVAAFYPSTARLVIPRNPKARLRTGSNGEYWVLAIAIALLVISCQFVSNGGLTELFERSFFRGADTAADVFKKHGSSQQVFVKVTGVNSATSEQIQGKEYKVISASDASVIGKADDGNLYQIGKGDGSQIRPTSVESRLGEKITIQAMELDPKDMFVSEWLLSVPSNAFITGTLQIDNAEGLSIPLEQKTFNTFKVSGGAIELLNATRQNLDAIADSFILQGKAIIKVRSDEQLKQVRRFTREVRRGDRIATNRKWCKREDQIFSIGNIS
jgi:inner membrane protein